MTVTSHARTDTPMPDPNFVHPELIAPETRSAKAGRYVAAALRISLGWVFLWAFLDKLLALGFSTGRDPVTGAVDRFGAAAWIHGGSPTEGFLAFGTKGPFAGIYQSFAGASWANWLFMLGLAGIGIALIAGVAMRIAAVSGTALLVFMWSAALLPSNNPIIDDHLIYAMALIALTLIGAGKTLGLGLRWEALPIVKQHAFLR